MGSYRSARMEKVDIIQIACNGFINETLRSTRMSLMSRIKSMASLTSFAYHLLNKLFIRPLNLSLMPTSNGCNSLVQLAGTKT